MNRFLLAAILVIVAANPCLAEDIAYQHKISVEQIIFEWALNADSIQVRLSAKTDGWVGIGFNPVQEMKGANFILGFVKDGKADIKDEFGTGMMSHAEDSKLGGKDNITIASGKEENGLTEIAFTIPLNSGDQYDTVIKPAEETTVLLAYDVGMKSFLIKHQYRTALKVNLSTGSYKALKE